MIGFAGTRSWVYPLAVTGRHQRLRRWTFLALHLVLFVTPWIRIAGHPALRFDLEARELFAFGAIFTASDTVLLLLLLLFLAFSLFLFTSLFGRLWCGYGCPQTVFLDAWIRPIEKWIEGDWVQRRRRDEAAWTLDKAWRKVAKWAAFGLVALVAAMAFMSFFAGAQFCNFLCPYARFQSALTDSETLTVTYDAARGEPRGGAGARAEGRCIACNKCVAVCPQGIDIRNGFQLECIGCDRCVDACEDVMGRLGHPSLVVHGTVAGATGRKLRWLRPRTVAYASLLTGIAATWIGLVVTRTPFEATVNRAPGSLYTMDGDGFVRNTYILRLTNNDPAAGGMQFHVSVEGLRNAEAITQDVRLDATESAALPIVIRVPATPGMPRTLPVRVRVASPAGDLRLDTTFKTGGALAATDPD
jgi:polyferredoxin